MDAILKRILVTGAALTAAAIVRHTAKRVKRQALRARADEPSNHLAYALTRSVVICPRCDHAAQVTSLEAQVESRWECGKCGTVWRELSTHDVVVR